MNIDFINQRKRELGLSNQQLCEISGLPMGTLSKIVAGINDNPKLETLRALAKALKCSLDDFSDDNQSKGEEFSISDMEKLLILSYRNTPNMQEAVNKLLGLDSPSLNKVKIKKRTGLNPTRDE